MNHKVQEIVDYIEGERQALLAGVQNLSQAQLDFKPAPEQWSVGEILHHLHVVEKGLPKLYAMLLQKTAEAGFKPETAGSMLQSLDHKQLDVPNQKLQAPKRVFPQAGIAKNELFALLKSSRQTLIDAVSQAGDYDLSEVKWPHPFFGDINFYQWILFVGKHEKRHLGQINRLKAAQGL